MHTNTALKALGPLIDKHKKDCTTQAWKGVEGGKALLHISTENVNRDPFKGQL